MDIHRILSAVCLVVAFAGTQLAPAPASAATIGINGSVLTATADPTGDQLLLGSTSGTDLELFGVFFDVVTPGCIDKGFISCSLIGLSEVRIVMGSGDDFVDLVDVGALPGLVFSVILGDGNDTLVAPGGNSRGWGGAGNDVLFGQGTGSCLSGGAGTNFVFDSSCDPGDEPVFEPAQPLTVPEPGSLALLLASLGFLCLARRGTAPVRARALTRRPPAIPAVAIT